jgi:hypothetical protein
VSTPSMLVLPEGSKSCINTLLHDLDLSRRVSVPTSSLPMDLGSISYFLRREETVVRAME